MRVRRLLLAALFASLPAPASACPAVAWGVPSQLAALQERPAPAGAVIYGTVRTVWGAPVPGALVLAHPLSHDGVADRAITDKEGRYVLRRLVPSAIALTVTSRNMGRVGPMPFRVPAEQGRKALPLRFDIGGMGPWVPTVPAARSGGTLASRLIHLPGVTRDLISDGRGGVEALELKGLASLTPRGAHPGINFGSLAVGASWTPGANRRLYTISGLEGPGELAAYNARGHELWCRALPFSPADVVAGKDGTAWVAGAHEGFGVVAIVSRTGKMVRTIALSPGSTLRVSTDAAGDGWVIDRNAGLLRLDPHGKILARVFLPEMPYAVYPTPDGGLWAIGGGIATRLDAHQKPIARVVRPQPIDLAAVDGQGRLWILEKGKLMAFAPHWARSYDLSGMPIQGAAGLAVANDRKLWLLGLDRQRVAVATVP